MAVNTADAAEPRVLPRALAGSTVMQIVRSLRETPEAHATVDVARALVMAGGRAIVAGESGALTAELKSFGGEWVPFASGTLNPAKLRANAEALGAFLTAQGVDIVHTKTAGAAWSARAAVKNHGARLVADLPDLPHLQMRLAAFGLGALGHADRVIARSLFMARPVIARYGIPPARVSVIPRAVDPVRFDPNTVTPDRVAALRQIWGIPSGVRIVLVPGRIAPWNGQLTLVKAARLLTDDGMRGVTFVFAGDDRLYRVYVQHIVRRARAEQVYPLFRFVGHCADMPAAYAAADFVVMPAARPPLYGRAAAEAQTMARPVIASLAGPLPENLLAPPRIPDDMRTGWLVRPRDPDDLAHALAEALALDAGGYRAMAARARHFGDFMFSPHRAAAATLDVYASSLKVEG